MTRDEELYVILAEECAEVIQECNKIIRYGEDAIYRDKTPLERLEKEVGDVLCMIGLLKDASKFSQYRLNRFEAEKFEKLHQWSSLFDAKSEA